MWKIKDILRHCDSQLSLSSLTLWPPDKCYHVHESHDNTSLDNEWKHYYDHDVPHQGNLPTMIQLRSDQSLHIQQAPSWSHCLEKTQGGLIHILLKIKKDIFGQIPVKNFISNLLTLSEAIKNFEVLNLDNINILYNFTRQKEGGLKCQLGSPFVHNLYRMVSGTFLFIEI